MMNAHWNVRAQRPQRAVLETLEKRALLSGNVLAVQAGDTLTLVGDELGNEVMLRSGRLPGEVIVHGMNRTLINGSNQDFVFVGVERLVAEMRGGDDWFKTTDLTLSAAALGSLLVDGGTGDDHIELKNTDVYATDGARVQIFGERSSAQTQPTTGNDSIQLANTRIIAGAGTFANAAVEIFGEFNVGGQVTGGNDTITITDTEISATDAILQDASALTIYGDINIDNDGGGVNSQGNDSISVTNTTISASGGEMRNSAFVEIVGDANQALSFESAGSAVISEGNDSISVTNITASSTGGDLAQSYVLLIQGDMNQVFNFSDGESKIAVGGNDTISVTNANFSATGGTRLDFAQLDIVGDHNATTSDFGTATVKAEGNDTISVDNVVVTTTGSEGQDLAALTVSGDFTQAISAGGVARAVVEGNDSIELKNTRVVASGAGFDSATVQIIGDASFTTGGPPVAEGDDEVVLRHVEVSGEFSEVLIDTSVGDDLLDVQNSSFNNFFASLQDGNDVAKFLANMFVQAELDGGPGFDELDAHNNIGVLTHSNFEEVNVTP
jgi:hypothetical protein